jgi:RNA polymerase sigma factor (sigma-70 family)
MRVDAGLAMTTDALRRAYADHRLALVRLATLVLRDESIAEDLVQDVFVRSKGRLESLDDAEAYAYLRRSVVNAWKNHRRHLAVEVASKSRLVARESIDPMTVVDERQTLWHAVERLPDRQRVVLVLRYYEDLPDAEIAELLGCSQVTVRTQAKRALDKLREVVDR